MPYRKYAAASYIAVTAPVCASSFHQFKVMAETHIRHVRTTTHVDIFFMMVQAWLIIMGDIFIKNSDFVSLAALHEGFARVMPAHLFLDNVVIFLGELMHPLFERFDIFLS